MGRSKFKNRQKLKITEENAEEKSEIVIENLPKNLLTMRVNSGTKMRNVLNYAMKEFGKYEGVLWTGTGEAVGRVISCVEIFKREHKDLHQVTKLRCTASAKTLEEGEKQRQVPEIHICLTKGPLNPSEPGYQRPDDRGMFQNSSSDLQELGQGIKSRISSITAEEFAKMGLRTGQKRPRGNFMDKTTIKKSKGHTST